MFPAKRSLHCDLKLVLNMDTFYGNLYRSKKVCRVHLTANCIKNTVCVRCEPYQQLTGNQSMVLINYGIREFATQCSPDSKGQK